MNDDLVARLRALLAAAESLPWHWQKSDLAGKTVDLKREHWVIGSAVSFRGLGLVFGDDARNARLVVDGLNALPELLDEIEEQRRLLDLHWEADQRGIKAWQQAHPGNELVWPDQGDLVEWLLNEIERLRSFEAANAEASEIIIELKQEVERLRRGECICPKCGQREGGERDDDGR